MTMKYSDALRNAQLNAITSTVGPLAKLRIYDGARPGSVATAVSTQKLLAEFTLGNPFAPSASAGALNPTLPSTVSALDTGVANWYRIVTSGNTAVIDGDASTTAGDMQLNTVSIGVGAQVSVTGWTINSGMSS